MCSRAQIGRFTNDVSRLHQGAEFLTGGYPASMVRAASGVKYRDFLAVCGCRSWALAMREIRDLDPPTRLLSLRGCGASASGSIASGRVDRRRRVLDRPPTPRRSLAAFGLRPSSWPG